MKQLNIRKWVIPLLVCSVFQLFSYSVVANDTITFTWKGGANKQFEISTHDETVISNILTIDWGDGFVEEKSVQYGFQLILSHTYADTNNYTVSIIGIIMRGLHLFCSNSQLSSLDVSKCEHLASLHCYGNSLPLSDLYVASTIIRNSSNKMFGTQILPTQRTVVGDTIDFSDQAMLGGKYTTFDVYKSGIHGNVPAVIGVDYTINGGKIVFHYADSAYYLIMTNIAISSSMGAPARVIVQFDVR